MCTHIHTHIQCFNCHFAVLRTLASCPFLCLYLLKKIMGITNAGFNRPDVLPITRPTVSKHPSKLKLTPSRKNYPQDSPFLKPPTVTGHIWDTVLNQLITLVKKLIKLTDCVINSIRKFDARRLSIGQLKNP